MINSAKFIGFFLALAMLVGCSQSELLQRMTSTEEQKTAQDYFKLLQEHKFEEIEKTADPTTTGPAIRDALTKMAAVIPPGEPTSITLVGVNRKTSTEFSAAELVYEYGFGDKWLLVSVSTKQSNGRTALIGLHVVPQTAGLKAMHRFTLQNKSALQYTILVLAVALPLFTLYALVICIRTKLQGRKWPWILFILFGVGKLAVNWTTGQIYLAPLSFQLFSAAATAPMYGPWTLAISLPLGAIVFLWRRSRLKASNVENIDAAAPGSAALSTP